MFPCENFRKWETMQLSHESSCWKSGYQERQVSLRTLLWRYLYSSSCQASTTGPAGGPTESQIHGQTKSLSISMLLGYIPTKSGLIFLSITITLPVLL
ncbi:unnamed protein product [Fusarium graminearum]|uniref:Chromosome 4, complete genome n=3 Tax=Gibberella zeae TaxID=5518 RepID=A0A098DVK0_GIBZE|nr:unnamed protein product [Fusarium graminearum]